MAVSTLRSRLDGHHRASSTTAPPNSAFISLRAHRRTHSTTASKVPSTTVTLQPKTSQDSGYLEGDTQLLLKQGRDTGNCELKKGGLKRKKGFLGVLDASIAYFSDTQYAVRKPISREEDDLLCNHLTALQAHLFSLETEHNSLSKTHSTLQTQQSLYTHHISTLTTTLQSLQTQLDSTDIIAPQGPVSKEPRRTIDSPQGYSESPYIRANIYSQHPVPRLPVQLSSVINFT